MKRFFARLHATDGHLHLTDDCIRSLCGERIRHDHKTGVAVVELQPGNAKRCPVCESLVGQTPLFPAAPLFGWSE